MKIPKLQTIFRSWEEAARQIATAINNEETYTMTLSSGTAATAISNPRVGIKSVMEFMPTTANAATDKNSMYVSARGNGTFTVAHANNGNGDRTFTYAVYG